jgi:hypothetical protein
LSQNRQNLTLSVGEAAPDSLMGAWHRSQISMGFPVLTFNTGMKKTLI